MSLVISAFPGCGKSTICKNAEQYGLINADVHYDDQEGVVISLPHSDTLVPVFDSDSSIFPKDKFPQNYIEHIKSVTEQYPDSVIMVSSHDNVRESMREAGIDYTLVYPQRELKGDYLERYKERGSPDQFVNMMDHKWNDFVDSSESDPTTDKLVLGEGEFLVDVVNDKIQKLVLSADTKKGLISGFESMGDIIRTSDGKTFDSSVPSSMSDYYKHKTSLVSPEPIEVTAAIIDVNADANNPDVIQPEVTGDVVVGVVNEPEGTAASTLTAEALEGGAIAVDASTPDDPAMGVEEPDRSELVEATIDMSGDVEVLEGVVALNADPENSGMEGLEDNSDLLTAASENIKERYGVDVPPTVSGMEGFLDSLKDAFTVINETLKGKPNKEKLAKIKKYLFEADKAIETYGSESWLNDQKFYNVGKTKMQIPAGFKDVTDLEGISKIIELYLKALDAQFDAQQKVASSRFKAALPIFNKFKKQKPEDADEDIKSLKDKLPIKPDRIPSPKPGELDSLMKVTLEKGELPVLTKDKIEKVVEIIDQILKVGIDWDKVIEKHTDRGLDYSDFSNSDFFSKYDDKTEVAELEDSLVWENSLSGMFEIQGAYGRAMLPVAKFLEQWILNSVK